METGKKRWIIMHPIQWKWGCWYGCVKDPDNSEIVYERADVHPNFCMRLLIDWCKEKNSEPASTKDEEYKQLLIEELINANTGEMGSSLDISGANSSQTI